MASLFETVRSMEKKSDQLRKLAIKQEDRLSSKVVDKIVTRSQAISLEADKLRALLRGPNKKKAAKAEIVKREDNKKYRKKVIEERKAAKQEKQNKARAKAKSLSMRGRGGGGGSIKSPDETARGRMSLLKKKM